ncbi:hypothetical protein PT7_3649 [Pusillimonas sp. T7-7]|nr:hypothetical protein PT7_3649 [Pusillimonas sp. T7-7]
MQADRSASLVKLMAQILGGADGCVLLPRSLFLDSRCEIRSNQPLP